MEFHHLDEDIQDEEMHIEIGKTTVQELMNIQDLGYNVYDVLLFSNVFSPFQSMDRYL
jgi:hypothetical protein